MTQTYFPFSFFRTGLHFFTFSRQVITFSRTKFSIYPIGNYLKRFIANLTILFNFNVWFITFKRTIFSIYPTRICFKNLITSYTNFCNRHFSSKIKAAFGLQKREQLSSQDLLTANFRHKKSVPSFALLIIALFLILSSISYAQEQIPDFGEGSVTILNNELQKIRNNIDSKSFYVGSLTRDMTSASGNVSYTGIGFSPKAVIFFNAKDSSGLNYLGWGFDGGAHAKGIFMATTTGIAYANAIYSINGYQDINNAQVAEIYSLDKDGFTLKWIKGGSPSAGTLTVYYMAFK